MSKELFVSSTPHETRVAMSEDGQLSEIYYERENEYTLAGSIYKGRVTRVLPGMQSAFVDIGLERDAFLYVSDFFELEEEDEEFEPVALSRPQSDAKPAQPSAPVETAPLEEEFVQTASGAVESADAAEPFVLEGGAEEGERLEAQPAPAETSSSDRGPRPWGRRRRRGRRGRGFPESKFARPAPAEERRPPEPQHRAPERERNRDRDYGPPPGYQPIILPGESISKYQRQAQPTVPEVRVPAEDEPAAAEAHPTPEEQARTEPPQALSDVSFAPVEQQTSPGQRRDDAAGMTAFETQRENQEPQRRRSDERRLEQMNVAAIFGGDAAVTDAPEVETAQEHDAEPWREHAREYAERTGQTEAGVPHPEPSQGWETEGQRAGDSQVPERPGQPEAHLTGPAASPESPLIAAPYEGAVEEEEIEEEEADLPAVSEEFDEFEFEELEEETFEPAGHEGEAMAAGEELTEAVEEAEEEREAVEGTFEHANHHVEFTESEQTNGRAEVRGHAGTAPYQQRAERGFDRRARGRRGGRRFRTRQAPRPPVMITDVLKEGQEVLVQIAKEPIGKKGARITSHIALPGRFLVYMPTVNHIGVSRKIASEEERQRLKRIVMGERENGHGGFIVRTAAENVREEELRADIRFLKNLWAEIKQRADNSKPPALIYHDLNLVERTLRDLVTEDFSHIWVDTEQEYERVLRFVNRFQPALVRRVRLYSKETPLFEQFGIQEEINKALKSKVWLKSGGYIVINQTEALVAIDVNTGKYVGKTQRLEDTIVKTNVDAIKEIVRQIRLRDLGGIIVIDFIDMDERRNRQKVMQALEEALRQDRAPSKVLAFNDFGLVAITRKRVKHSLERMLGAPCPYCTGTGLVKSVTTVCNEIYTELRKLRRQFEKERDILLRVNPEVAKALKANNARWLNDMEELVGKPIIVKPDPLLHQEQFDF